MGVYLPLPSEYQEVEYIQSSGTQYIILGNSFKTSYKAVIDFQMTVIGGDYIPLGIKYSTTRYGIDVYNSKFMVNGGGEIWNNTISEDTNRHTITIDKGTARVDGNNYSVSYTNYTFSQGIGVFCYNEYDKSPQYNYKSSNKLYKLDIYDENGKHIYDIVPCYRKSDGVIGLYDLVNSVFYTNSGTGTFSKGADITAVPLKNAYIGGSTTYEYSYDFRNKSSTTLTNDGWTIGGGSPSFDSNGMKGAGTYVNRSLPSITTANKIILKHTFNVGGSGSSLFRIGKMSGGSLTNVSGSYSRCGNYRRITIGNDATNYNGLPAGTYTFVMTIDLVNKTREVTTTGLTTLTGTITDAEKAIIQANTSDIRADTYSSGSGLSGYLQSLYVYIEYGL